MSKRVTAIIEEARKLTHEERLDLLDQLRIELSTDDADEGTREEIKAAWLEEVERRMEKARRGDATSIGHDEMMQKLRGLIRRP
jgi:hypothetical protein